MNTKSVLCTFAGTLLMFVPLSQGQAIPEAGASQKSAPVYLPAPTDPPSSTGFAESHRVEDDAKRLQQRLGDWANLAFYHEANLKVEQPKAEEKRVIFMGDSITHNWGNAKYSRYFSTHSYLNRGIGGQTTAQMLLRFGPDVVALHPRVVVLLAGTNDLATFRVPDLLEFTESNLASMVELAQAHGIVPVLSSVLPVSDVYKLQTDRRQPEKILALNSWLKGYAQRNHLLYIDYYSAVVDEKGFFKTEYTVDGLHPSAAGFKVMESLVDEAIRKALAEPEAKSAPLHTIWR